MSAVVHARDRRSRLLAGGLVLALCSCSGNESPAVPDPAAADRAWVTSELSRLHMAAHMTVPGVEVGTDRPKEVRELVRCLTAVRRARWMLEQARPEGSPFVPSEDPRHQALYEQVRDILDVARTQETAARQALDEARQRALDQATPADHPRVQAAYAEPVGEP